MKRINVIIAAFLGVLLLSSCSQGRVVYEQQTKRLEPSGRSWTVLLYMCGGSDETKTGATSDKLRELMSVDYPENVNVLVQTGGSKEWHTKGVYTDYVQRFEMGKDTMYLADQEMAANMGSASTLADFLKWGTSNYKADNYMVILSGKGGGAVNGAAFDEQNENDSLTLDELSYAMNSTGVTFNIVGFDASLMGSLETASALSTCTDYMIASQEYLSRGGWDLAEAIKYICENPSADTRDICKQICDTYYAKCEKNGEEADAVMSAVDISKISALTQAFDGMAGNMLALTESFDGYVNLSSALRGAEIFGANTADEGYSNAMDMGAMASLARDYIGGTADALIAALNETVVYRVCGSRHTAATGLSVYYPLHADSEELQEYMSIATSGIYKEYLKKICVNCYVEDPIVTADYTSSGAWTVYDNDLKWLEYKSILDNNVYSLNILGNMGLFSDISLDVYKYDEESGEYAYLGEYDGCDTQWDAGIFNDNFNGKMMRLCGKAVTMRKVRSITDSDGAVYELYSIPVILNGERSNIRLLRDEGGKYEILGAWDGCDETGGAGTGMRPLKFNDRITPVYPVYSEDRGKTEYITGHGGMKMFGAMRENNVEDGEYMLEYRMTDIYGLNRYGTAVKGDCVSGQITYK